jgi:regulator of nucleoside diphosphate kinase
MGGFKMTAKMNTIESNATITVTQIDFLRLTRLIQTLRENKSVDMQYLKFLGMELQKALKVDSRLITPDFITMNSVMNVIFIDSGKTMEIRLVYPQNADFSKGLISVLSPCGCALLGYKEGDMVTFQAPKGLQKVKINKVTYQPEAHGEDLL